MQTVADVKCNQPWSSPHGMLPYFPSCRDALSGQPLYFNVIQMKLTYSLATFYFKTFKRTTPATLHRFIELTICRYVLSFDLCIYNDSSQTWPARKNGFHKNDGLWFLGFPPTVENTKTTIIMGHSEDGYFEGESIEIQHKIFISSSHRSSVRHVFPPCPHRKI